MKKDFKIQDVRNKVVLLAALDWGMGHTTRCVALIRQLLLNNNELIFTGNEKQINFLKREFPALKYETIGGYGITLNSKRNTYAQMAAQAKKVASAMKGEKKWLKNYIKANKVDLVVSDNRYGFYHKKITSIILTHQLNLQIPSFKWVTNKFLHKKLCKFDVCWVPDNKERPLTGELSNAKIKIPVCFIGLLNRFEKAEAEEVYDYLIILSGPEPERTNFLDYAKQQATDLGGSIAFVGAEVDGYESFLNPTTKQLGVLIAQSKSVYSRAGYTTIMEMIGLDKKAVLIPTKGQYEQLYLAEYIRNDKISFIQADI